MPCKHSNEIKNIDINTIAMQEQPKLNNCNQKVNHEHEINPEIIKNLSHKTPRSYLSDEERYKAMQELKLEAVSESMLNAPCITPPSFLHKDEEEITALVLSRLIFGQKLTWDEAVYCFEKISLDNLINLSHEVTKQIAGNKASLCSITNVKSGACSQDCKWCAQSSHYHTDAEVYGIKDPEQCVKEAQLSYEQGVEMFSFVASGRKPNRIELAQLTLLSDHIKQKIPIKMCASLGLLDEEQLRVIKKHHITRYHCNLESAPSYFHHVVTSHSIIDKLKTIRSAQKVGIEMCSGGIIGMGESSRQRLELAWTLAQLGIQSIPINILHPILGTPLYNIPKLSDEEILRTIAIFRLLNPNAHLRFAGGRILLSEQMVDKAIYAGMNAAIVGDLLTTLGSNVEQDRERFTKHDYIIPPKPNKS